MRICRTFSIIFAGLATILWSITGAQEDEGLVGGVKERLLTLEDTVAEIQAGGSSQYAVIDAEGRVIGYPFDFSFASARLAFESSIGLIEVSVHGQGISTIGSLLFDAPNCQGSGYLDFTVSPADYNLMTPVEAHDGLDLYVADPNAASEEDVEIYSVLSANGNCIDVSTTSERAATLVFREVLLDAANCQTPEYGLDDSEPMGVLLNLAAFGEHKQMKNAGDGTLEARYFVEGLASDGTINRQTGVELYVTAPSPQACTYFGDVNLELSQEVVFACDTPSGRQALLDYSLTSKSRCFEATLTPLPGVHVFPKIYGSIQPAMKVDVRFPEFTAPLKIQRALPSTSD